jgi:hypothetical protein
MAFVTRKFANVGQSDPSGRYFAPMTPGAIKSPQIPGEVPDRSHVPGEDVLPVPAPEGDIRRPVVEYGTAQHIMGIYNKPELEVTDPKRFEIESEFPAEEVRKAFAGQLRTPLRPSPGYALAAGTRMSNERLAALSAESAANAPFDPGE